jgi:hypothetical protein
MTEDPTNDLTTDEILRALLVDMRTLTADMQDVKARLGALESLFEDRFKDTRPIWHAINARTERIEEILSDIKGEIATLAYDSVQK